MDKHMQSGPIVSSGILLGAGLGGFVDGILLHQMAAGRYAHEPGLNDRCRGSHRARLPLAPLQPRRRKARVAGGGAGLRRFNRPNAMGTLALHEQGETAVPRPAA